MSKKGIQGYITLAIILIVFSVIAFAAPFSMTASFWLSYIFGIIAIVFQIYVFKIAFSGGGGAKSRFYGFPIAKVGVIYLIVQLVISLVGMCVSAIIPTGVVLIIDIIPIALAIVGCIATDTMRDEIVRQDIQLKKDVTNMRSLQSLSAAIVAQCKDSELKKVLQKMADEFRFSDPVSSDQTVMIEGEIQIQMKELQKAITEDDVVSAKSLAEKISSGLAERNRICALSK